MYGFTTEQSSTLLEVFCEDLLDSLVRGDEIIQEGGGVRVIGDLQERARILQQYVHERKAYIKQYNDLLLTVK